MSAQGFLVRNGPMGTTAPPPKVVTGTATKTMLQLLNNTTAWRVVEWGISFDGTSGTPNQCELVATSTIAATGTAFVAADITQFTDPLSNAPPGMVYSTTGSMYTATAEGAITTLRTGDLQLVSPAGGYLKQFPLGREFEVSSTHVCRIRVTAPVTVNCSCYIQFEV